MTGPSLGHELHKTEPNGHLQDFKWGGGRVNSVFLYMQETAFFKRFNSPNPFPY